MCIEGRKERIIACAIQNVAENGLAGARTLVIAQNAGIAEPTLFQHFGTKKNLLNACFETVDKQIAALFRGMKFTPEQVRKDPEGSIFLLWSKYFKWLVDHREETLFYFYFRTDTSFPEYERNREAPWFDDFKEIFEAFDQEYHLYEKVPPTVLWTHVLTVTQLYAKMMLEGFLPLEDRTIRAIFRTQMGALCAAVTEDAENEKQ